MYLAIACPASTTVQPRSLWRCVTAPVAAGLLLMMVALAPVHAGGRAPAETRQAMPGDSVAPGPAEGIPVLSQDRLLGAFIATTRLEAGTEFDSNPFGRRTNVVSDRIDSVAPGLTIASRWARHSLTIDLGVDHRMYDKAGFNATDLTGRMSGIINIARGLDVGADIERRRQSSLNSPSTANPQNLLGTTNQPISPVDLFGNRDIPGNVASPVPTTQGLERVWARYNGPRITNTVSATWQNSEFGSVQTDIGATVQLGSLSSEQLRLENRTEVRLSHRLRTVVAVSETTREFPTLSARNSTTRAIDNAWELMLTPLVSTNLILAIAQEKFDANSFDPSNSKSATVGLNYQPRRYLALGAAATAGEAGVNFEQDSSSSKFWGISSSLKYDITRRLALQGGASYLHADREALRSGPRTDDNYSWNLGLTYNFWRDATIGLQHGQRLTKSSDTPNDLDQQTTRLQLRARF